MSKLEKLTTSTKVEESAKLVVPSGSESDPFHKLAFFNPRMSFNRSVSSLALGVLHELDEKFDEITLLDGLCATGARGARYVLENSFVKQVVFVDGNEHALELLEKNVKLNKLSKKAKWVHSEFNEFLENTEEQFDFLEIDPFGTPAPFLKNALKKISFGKTAEKNAKAKGANAIGKERSYGILSVTSTDLASLCGKEPQKCIKNYSSKPMRCAFTHEIALRILIGKIALDAAKLGLLAQPVFSFYNGHAVKTLCKISKQPKTGKKGKFAPTIGFVSLCRNCLLREWGGNKIEKCPECGSKMDYAGPLWLEETSRKEFVDKMLEMLKKRNYSERKKIEKMLLPLKEEIGLPPFFFDLHEIAGKLVTHAPKTAEVVEKLKKEGFEASFTHYSPVGVRTDAPLEEINKLYTAN